jgi:hypothetical protein
MVPYFPEHPVLHQSIDVTDIDWVHCVAVRWNFWEHFHCNISRPIKNPLLYCFIKLNSNFIKFLLKDFIVPWRYRLWRTLGHSSTIKIKDMIIYMSVQCLTTDWFIGLRSPAEAKGLFLYPLCPDGSGAHSASCTMGTGGPSPGVKRGRSVTLITHPL